MLLKTEDKKDFELSFRPVADPTEIINEKTDKKDIIIIREKCRIATLRVSILFINHTK